MDDVIVSGEFLHALSHGSRRRQVSVQSGLPLAQLRSFSQQLLSCRQIVLQEIVILDFEGIVPIVLHEVIEVLHEFEVLIGTCHACHAVARHQVPRQLIGKGLQVLILTHIPQVPRLVDELGRVVVQTVRS